MNIFTKKQGIIFAIITFFIFCAALYCLIFSNILWGIILFFIAILSAVISVVILRMALIYLSQKNMLPLKIIQEEDINNQLKLNLDGNGFTAENDGCLYKKTDNKKIIFFFHGNFASIPEILKYCKKNYGINTDEEFNKELLTAYGYIISEDKDLASKRKEIELKMKKYYENPILSQSKKQAVFIFFDSSLNVRKLPYEDYIFPLPPVYSNAVCPIITFISRAPDGKNCRLATKAQNFDRTARKEIKIIFKNIIDFK